MTAPKIKICGVTTPDALDAAIIARGDYVGFNFHPPSPRYLALTDAAKLAARAGDSIGKVGVFVNADDHTIAVAIDAGKLDVVQLQHPALAGVLPHVARADVVGHAVDPGAQGTVAAKAGQALPQRQVQLLLQLLP